jgi:predicted NUDIX family phosphoesterase
VPHPEKILVIPAYRARTLGLGGAGFLPTASACSLLALLERGQFRVRDSVEHDPAYLQLIPYVYLVHGAGADLRIVSYRRGDGGGEDRLHARRSIGFGGHVEEADMSGYTSGPTQLYYALNSAMHREPDEEVEYRPLLSAQAFRHVGYLRDPSSPVGAVHLGVVHRQAMEAPAIESLEPDAIVDLRLETPGDLARDRDLYETWSRILIDALAEDATLLGRAVTGAVETTA